VKWKWLPILGWTPLTENLTENLRHSFLPAFTIALLEMATYTRLLRGDLLTTFQEDYILAARAKGLSTPRVLTAHALRPSMFTLVTLGGLSFARLLGGTVIVETLFTLPGLGRLVLDAVRFGDLPVVQGVVILIAVAYLIINTVVDMAYGWLDPRVRAQGAS
jgi:peptide/nickel transport system permease protein